MKENTRSVMDRIGAVVLPLMMFLVLTDVNRIVTLVAALAALVFVLGRKPQMEQRMAPLTVGWEMYSCSAALRMLPVSATARKISRCRSVMWIPLFIFYVMIGFSL